MNDLVLVNKAAEWQRLKTLVLDSVSSPITRRVYNMALDEFFEWYSFEPRPGFSKATVSAWRVSLEVRGLGSSSIIIRMSAIRKLATEASGQRAARARDGGWHHPREEREIEGCPSWQLALAAASAGAAQRSRTSKR